MSGASDVLSILLSSAQAHFLNLKHLAVPTSALLRLQDASVIPLDLRFRGISG